MQDLHGQKVMLSGEESHGGFGHYPSEVVTSSTPHFNESGFEVNPCHSHSYIMGNVFHNASPYLYPCTIEYSLICAAILFVMWKNVGHGEMKE